MGVGAEIGSRDSRGYTPLLVRSLGCVALLVAACGSAPSKPDRALAFSPEGLHAFFVTCVRADELGWAHRVLTPQSRRQIPQDEWILALGQEPVARLITDSRLVAWRAEGDAGWHEVESLQFGFRRRLRIVREAGQLWTYDLAREDFEAIVEAVTAHYERRPELYDGRRHVFPDGWRHPPLGSR